MKPWNAWSVRCLGVILIVLLLLPGLAACNRVPADPTPEPPPTPPPSPTALKILFIGSSYLDCNNLPKLFSQLAAAAGKSVIIGTRIVNGTYLDFHAENPATLEKIQSEAWDCVILQDAGHNVAYPNTQHKILPPYELHHTFDCLKALYTRIKQRNAAARVIFFMPWAFEDGLTWVRGQTDTYEDMQKMILKNTLLWSKAIGFVTAPVGWAYYRVMQERPDLHYLYVNDYNHPSLRGSYLSACVFFVTIYQEKLSKVSFTDTLNEAEAFYFQDMASLTVLEDPAQWNLSGGTAAAR